jgi:hypothetical protein
MALLCRARLLVSLVPFRHWRGALGCAGRVDLAEAEGRACLVEWAARRLPFPTKCLPRAMVLSWILSRESLGHIVVLAVRPSASRGTDSDLHAWVEVEGKTILGDLPGPWIETLRLGG